jgi:MFS family permease
VSGLLFSLTAGGGALGNTSCAVLLRRATARTVIRAGGALAAAAVLVFVIAPVPSALYVAAFVFGVAIGAAMTAAYTAGGSVMPPEARGTGFGFLTSGSLAGLAISPMVSGLLGAISIPAVFVVDAVVLGMLCLAVTRLMADRAAPETSPAPPEL